MAGNTKLMETPLYAKTHRSSLLRDTLEEAMISCNFCSNQKVLSLQKEMNSAHWSSLCSHSKSPINTPALDRSTTFHHQGFNGVLFLGEWISQQAEMITNNNGQEFSYKYLTWKFACSKIAASRALFDSRAVASALLLVHPSHPKTENLAAIWYYDYYVLLTIQCYSHA